MSLWIAKTVVYCPGFGSFKALSAYRLFLDSFDPNLVAQADVMITKPSRATFYQALRTNIEQGRIRSAIAIEKSTFLTTVDVKIVRKTTGLFFEDFVIDIQELCNPELPVLINETEREKLMLMQGETRLQSLFHLPASLSEAQGAQANSPISL